MKHTKDKWIFKNVFGRLLITAGENGFVIATVTNQSITHFIKNEEEAIANAKLMTASPKMLKALKEISEGKGRYNEDRLIHASNTIEDMVIIANKAIKEATP